MFYDVPRVWLVGLKDCVPVREVKGRPHALTPQFTVLFGLPSLQISVCWFYSLSVQLVLGSLGY